MKDSDEDDLHDKDYDVAVLANNLSQALRYKIYGGDDAEEVMSSASYITKIWLHILYTEKYHFYIPY